MGHYETLKVSCWIRAEVLHRQHSVLAEASVRSFKQNAVNGVQLSSAAATFCLSSMEYYLSPEI